MGSLDRERSISHLTIEEVREELREESIWCYRLWGYLCALFTLEFWVTPPRRRE